MQPYLFPYLGYYQLANAVDKFVFYDDVTFIKGGYINRNNILSCGKAQRFTIPVIGMSSNKLIGELEFDKNVRKILKSIEQSYRGAPYFGIVYPLIDAVLTCENRSVSHICAKSITEVFKYLGISREFLFSSDLVYDREISAAEKLISMSTILKETDYINSPGGKALYDKDDFTAKGVNLSFIEIKDYEYKQVNSDFVPHLSMIDVLMWNDIGSVNEMLTRFRLV
jgi:hypothetical protein